MRNQKKIFILLSYPIKESVPLYGTTPLPKVEKYTSIKAGHSTNSSIVILHTHTGTHVDFPYHFFEEGLKSSDYSFNDFIYIHPILIDIPRSYGEFVEDKHLKFFSKELEKADLVLIRTGFSIYRKNKIYRTHNPGIHSNAMRYLRLKFKNVRAVGIDSISISSYQHREEGREAHKEAFKVSNAYGEPLLLIEDLKLNGINTLKSVILVPFSIDGLDGAPCTVIGKII